jgi:hypothetical protein
MKIPEQQFLPLSYQLPPRCSPGLAVNSPTLPLQAHLLFPKEGNIEQVLSPGMGTGRDPFLPSDFHPGLRVVVPLLAPTTRCCCLPRRRYQRKPATSAPTNSDE